MMMYGAPIWMNALSPRNVPLLRRPQRVVALRAGRAYRTVSQWVLEAAVLAAIYWRGVRKQVRRGKTHVRWTPGARSYF